MWPTCTEKRKLILVAGLFLLTMQLFPQESILERRVKMPGNSIRASRALSEVSRLTGYIFTYDTRIIDEDRVFTLPPSDITVRELLDSVTGDPVIRYSVIEKHIILYRDIISDTQEPVTDTLSVLHVLTGKVVDAGTSEPLPFATVGIRHRGRGMVTNNNGDFILKIPDECLDDTLSVSYVGYINRLLPVRSLPGNVMTISMERDFIPIPEIIIRAQDPVLIIGKAISSVASNYGTTPVLLTGFYREGVTGKRNPRSIRRQWCRSIRAPMPGHCRMTR
jgi:hypothetical protein